MAVPSPPFSATAHAFQADPRTRKERAGESSLQHGTAGLGTPAGGDANGPADPGTPADPVAESASDRGSESGDGAQAPAGLSPAGLSPADLETAWAAVREDIRDQIGETAYRSWVKPLTLDGLNGAAVRLLVPTRFMRDWVNSHYGDVLGDLWRRHSGQVRAVEIVTARRAAGPGPGVASPGAAGQPAPGQPAAGQPSATTGTATTGTATTGTASDSGAERGAIGGAGGSGRALPPRAPGQGGDTLFSARARESHVRESHAERGSRAGGFTSPAASEQAELDDISARLDPRFTFANFVVGKPNELAHAAARRVADAEEVPFNPLFLYGGVGLGKTHLMHAIAQHIREHAPAKRIVYLSAEKFMYQFIRALRFKDTVAFKQLFRSVDVLMIDDVQFIAGKDSTQEEFFHTFNALVDNHRQVVISADKSPSDLQGIEERLKSRLSWGLVADIHPTSYELRLGILETKAERLGMQVPRRVLEFLAHRITANVRELEGALHRLVAHADLVGRPVTIETAQELLADLLRANDRRVSIDEIQRKVAEHYAIKVADMHSARRARVVARPRQVAMYLAKQLTQRSLPEIGRKFGGRDHTTVMHAIAKVEELAGKEADFAEDVELLRRSLTS